MPKLPFRIGSTTTRTRLKVVDTCCPLFAVMHKIRVCVPQIYVPSDPTKAEHQTDKTPCETNDYIDLNQGAWQQSIMKRILIFFGTLKEARIKILCYTES